MFASVRSGAVVGVDAIPVTVEVDIGPGLQAFHVVGLPDGAVREARVRVKAALQNNDLEWPMRRISVNLAPADIRKDGTLFDLPIALAVMAGGGAFRKRALARLDGYLVAGELSLDGEIRSVRGALPLALAARARGMEGVILPRCNAPEAALVDGLDVVGCQTITEAVDFVRGLRDDLSFQRDASDRDVETDTPYDLSDVRGQELAKRALEVAAAGGHNLLFVGPPGSGKTMLSKRLSTVLPPMSLEESLETTKVHSVSGLLGEYALVSHRPFRAPHHTISEPGLVGGGSGSPRPGEVSLAHNGVLFLDELPEFRRSVLEVLRQPLEDGHVTVSRSLVTVNYPARVMLVASMNPCPCGFLGDRRHACSCTPQQVQMYRSRISGPLLDRIDLQVDVPAARYDELRDLSPGEPSSAVRARVQRARDRQLHRLSGLGMTCNAEMGARQIREVCKVDAAGHELLEKVVDKLGMSARAHARILKVARTIADLDGVDDIGIAHLAEAVQYRKLDRRDAA